MAFHMLWSAAVFKLWGINFLQHIIMSGSKILKLAVYFLNSDGGLLF